MPVSIDPEPAEDEIECARCGAHFYYGLSRCPNCGVNLYEPDDEAEQEDPQKFRLQTSSQRGLGARLDGFVRRLTKKPYPAELLFGTSIDQAGLFNDLLIKVGGDRATVERLIDFERQRSPQGNRILWLRNAIQRWEQDNRGSEPT
jgi:hypothetical protein